MSIKSRYEIEKTKFVAYSVNMSYIEILNRDFVKKRRKNRFTLTALYEELNIQNTLDISLRSFQRAISADQKMDRRLFQTLFNHVTDDLKKEFFLIDLAKTFGNNSDIFQYINDSLGVPPPKNKVDFGKIKSKKYTEEQLNYLSKNPSMLKMHKRILLRGKVSKQKCLDVISRTSMQKLIDLELVALKDGYYEPFHSVYTYTNNKDADSAMKQAKARFFIAQIDTYLDREYKDQQITSMSSLMVNKENLSTIKDKIHETNTWIKKRSVYIDRNSDKLVPVYYSSIFKVIGE